MLKVFGSGLVNQVFPLVYSKGKYSSHTEYLIFIKHLYPNVHTDITTKLHENTKCW